MLKVILLIGTIILLGFFFLETRMMISNAASLDGNATNIQDPNFIVSWYTILAGLIGTLVGSAGTIFVALINSKYNLKNTIVNNKYNIEKDLTKNLHDQRMSVYADLLKCTEPLALHDASVVLNHADIFETSKRLTNWYYIGKGGILMTKESEDKYVSIKNFLNAYAKKIIKPEDYDVELSSDENVNIRKLCHDFHSSLRNELGVK